ncbi:hypothetical protein SOQ14_09585 [Erythrobacter sp. T5W1-R]|uniref:hypothetical protein n=1 Tax=Erythrobacter sp. T5W1-R TaxID=3101752 RepID=UPI002AFEC7EF|nr:hypothetical protein [Erythrobacter sp. T5W1-R]MEA1619170.1 hypothetical protein [Erythrobacter sp. T5W1-R]
MQHYKIGQALTTERILGVASRSFKLLLGREQMAMLYDTMESGFRVCSRGPVGQFENIKSLKDLTIGDAKVADDAAFASRRDVGAVDDVAGALSHMTLPRLLGSVVADALKNELPPFLVGKWPQVSRQPELSQRPTRDVVHHIALLLLPGFIAPVSLPDNPKPTPPHGAFAFGLGKFTFDPSHRFDVLRFRPCLGPYRPVS